MEVSDPVRWWLTPTLVVGEDPEEFDTVQVATAEEVVSVVLNGGTARLPANHWNEARRALALLGLSRAQIAFAERVARGWD